MQRGSSECVGSGNVGECHMLECQLENYLGWLFLRFLFFFFSIVDYWTEDTVYVHIDEVQSEGNLRFAQSQSWKCLLILDSDCKLCQYLKGFRLCLDKSNNSRKRYLEILEVRLS